MSDVVVTVVESNTNVTVSEQDVAVAVTENTVQVSASTAGIQGIPGANNDPTYVTVRNSTGATLAKGTIVYISGANGNNVQVTPAIATGDSTSARTLGWLAASIANNASGLCMVEGYLEGLNTQGITAGAQLYLSGTTAGAFTATEPVAPTHLVYVGVATKISAGDGHVFVKVQNGYELDELHNVLITSPTNNQVLAYDSATQLWKNATNAPDGVTSITATAPLTGGTITSTGSIGLDQTALSLTRSQITDFTSGTVTSASTAQQSGTAVYSVNSGTAVYSTTSGTAVFATNASTAVNLSGSITKSQVSDFTSGTVASASTAQQAGTAVFADTSGTATYSTTSGTALTISGSITKSQVSDFTSGTVTSASTAQQSGTAVTISGSIAQSQVTSLVTDLAGKASLGTANAFTVGGHSITAQSTAIVPLVLKGASGQTGDLLQVQSSDATNVIRLRPSLTNQTSSVATINGPVDIQPTAGGAGYGLFVRPGAAGVPAVLVRGAASQSANLQEWQNSGSTVVASVSSAGSFTTALDLTVNRFSFFAGSLNHTSSTGSYINLQSSNAVKVSSRAAGQVGFVVQGAASQSADLLQIQNSAGTNLVRADTYGGLYSTYATFTSDAAATRPLLVKGAASQSANLQEWQTSAGGTVAKVDSVGDITARVQRSTFAARFTTTDSSIAIQVNTGAVSQTGDFLQNQNSGGTVLSKLQADGGASFSSGNAVITSTGIVRGVNLNTTNDRVTLVEESGGGRLRLTKATAIMTNPGADIAKIYLRDGTTAGTLKLVVRAGAAGAETTILDNIPQ